MTLFGATQKDLTVDLRRNPPTIPLSYTMSATETFRTAEKITAVDQDLYRDRKWAGKTITGPSHPELDLCELLRSGKARHITLGQNKQRKCFTPAVTHAITLSHTQP